MTVDFSSHIVLIGLKQEPIGPSRQMIHCLKDLHVIGTVYLFSLSGLAKCNLFEFTTTKSIKNLLWIFLSITLLFLSKEERNGG